MKIHGFQKMTLLDYPGKVACTIFTGGCNLRCPFCHNALLVTKLGDAPTIPEEEIFDILSKRRGLIDGVCITGGEPLLQPDIAEFIAKIKAMGYPVKLDTNGCFPEKLEALINDGLVDYVALDIKNSREKYAATVGIDDFDVSPIERTVELLKRGRVEYEFRTTVVDEFHDEKDIESIAEWIDGSPKYFLQNFKDSGDLIGDDMHPKSREILENMRKIAKNRIKTVEIRGID